VEEEEAKDEMYCSLQTKVVGVQYYTGSLCCVILSLTNIVLGLVGMGEEVTLVREPKNRYDR
jgi:SWI/SNF-related matrix-associated actin-dependent regulator of chromatin subfamily A3